MSDWFAGEDPQISGIHEGRSLDLWWYQTRTENGRLV
jgi:hypothetical protein